MKSRKIMKKRTEYFEECPYCKKEIKGFSESQVEYNLKTHINAKHKKKNA